MDGPLGLYLKSFDYGSSPQQRPVGHRRQCRGKSVHLHHYNSVVRKVDRNGTITTFAGTGETGFNREKGLATKVMLNELWGLFVDDAAGVLYIGDTFNARIRAVYLEGS